jgi:hypothetical protein
MKSLSAIFLIFLINSSFSQEKYRNIQFVEEDTCPNQYRVTIQTSIQALKKAGKIEPNTDSGTSSRYVATDDWSIQIYDRNDNRILIVEDDKLDPEFDINEIICSSNSTENFKIYAFDNDYTWLSLGIDWGKWDNDRYRIISLSMKSNESEVNSILVKNESIITSLTETFDSKTDNYTVSITKEAANEEGKNELLDKTVRVEKRNEIRTYKKITENNTYLVYSIKIERI